MFQTPRSEFDWNGNELASMDERKGGVGVAAHALDGAAHLEVPVLVDGDGGVGAEAPPLGGDARTEVPVLDGDSVVVGLAAHALGGAAHPEVPVLVDGDFVFGLPDHALGGAAHPEVPVLDGDFVVGVAGHALGGAARPDNSVLDGDGGVGIDAPAVGGDARLDVSVVKGDSGVGIGSLEFIFPTESDSSEEYVCVLGILNEEAKKERAAEAERTRQAVLRWQQTEKNLDRNHANDMASIRNVLPLQIFGSLPSTEAYEKVTDKIALATLQMEKEYAQLHGRNQICNVDVPSDISQGI